MGQKVNPHGLRVGVIKDWDSKWYAESDFADFLVEDYNIRTFLKKKLYAAGVSKIEIERASDRVKVILYTASHQYGYTNTGCIYSISQSLACRTGLPYSQIQDRDTPYVSLYTQTHRSPYMHLLCGFESIQGTGAHAESLRD